MRHFAQQVLKLYEFDANKIEEKENFTKILI